LKLARAVHLPPKHTNVSKGDEHMDSKTMKLGNSTVTVYSNLVNMTPSERKEWFDREWANGNSVLKDMAGVISEIATTTETDP
jgi:hypothetical protein